MEEKEYINLVKKKQIFSTTKQEQPVKGLPVEVISETASKLQMLAIDKCQLKEKLKQEYTGLILEA